MREIQAAVVHDWIVTDKPATETKTCHKSNNCIGDLLMGLIFEANGKWEWLPFI
jgi:hypothetical protein